MLNTDNKKRIFKNQPYNGKIEYHRNTDNFYIIQAHNKICDIFDVKEFKNTADNSLNVKNYSQYKQSLIKFLFSLEKLIKL